ncbi:hypothetical protein [Streptomyces sp. MMBL 11-1]|uniref:hypothetical protein n=1 Tax=Streptomyces sp. MMBL 11-1 TaxID=3026420 RepID=UPI002360635B|nr:hypothetical protein [Streptomyces sp. MMBL 11-1]
MTMSRKHYREAAAVLRSALPPEGKRQPTRTKTVREIADGLAGLFARDNPRFRRTTFIDAVFEDTR